MKQFACLRIALLVVLTAGCVERRVHITSDPPGALVYKNGHALGPATPCDDYFLYYGKYEYDLVLDGYQTLHVVENLQAPIYEYPGIDFLSEHVWPFHVKDDRRLHYVLQPLTKDPPDAILKKAVELQTRGLAIGQPGGNPSSAGVPIVSPTPNAPVAPRGTTASSAPPAAPEPVNGSSLGQPTPVRP